jgi:hypothetical protein
MVDPLPAIRAAYGDSVADVVGLSADLIRGRRDVPSAQDQKHTLRRIAEAPGAACLVDLDTHTDAALVAAAWRLYRVVDLAELPAASVALCARDALRAFAWKRGRISTDDIAVPMVRKLLDITPDLDRGEQMALIGKALQACRLGFDHKNIERLRTAAGQLL